jgi:hypothetical protein
MIVIIPGITNIYSQDIQDMQDIQDIQIQDIPAVAL